MANTTKNSIREVRVLTLALSMIELLVSIHILQNGVPVIRISHTINSQDMRCTYTMGTIVDLALYKEEHILFRPFVLIKYS